MGGESHDETLTSIRSTIYSQIMHMLIIRCIDTSIQNGISDTKASIDSNNCSPAETINGAGPDTQEGDSEVEQRVDSTQNFLTTQSRMLILMKMSFQLP